MITMTSLSLLTALAGTSLAPMTAVTSAEVRVVDLEPPQPETPHRVTISTGAASDNEIVTAVELGQPVPVVSAGAVYQFEQDDGDESFVIKIEGGKVIDLKLNGDDISKDHFTFNDGEIVILDDDGNAVTRHNIHRFGSDVSTPPTPPGAPRVLRFGQGGNFVFSKENNARFFTDNAGNQVTWDFEPKVMVGINQGVPSAALRYHLGLSDDQPCILIERVIDGLSASAAGMHQFDVVVKADGKNADDGVLRELLSEKEPGQSVTFEIIRKGEPMQLMIELQAYDGSKLVGSNMQFFGGGDEDENVFVTSPGNVEWIVAPGVPSAPRVRVAPGAVRVQGVPSVQNVGEFRFRGEDFRDPDKAPEVIRHLREQIQQHADRVQLDGDRLMIFQDAELMVAEQLERAQQAQQAMQAQQAVKVQRVEATAPRHEARPEAADRLDQIEQRLEMLESSLSDRLESLFDRLDSISAQLKDRAAESDEGEI
ncbi:MAG: hypothetical protein ACI89L_002164 [Phycisphaerales bacterium]|jgi:hypothetical protein